MCYAAQPTIQVQVQVWEVFLHVGWPATVYTHTYQLGTREIMPIAISEKSGAGYSSLTLCCLLDLVMIKTQHLKSMISQPRLAGIFARRWHLQANTRKWSHRGRATHKHDQASTATQHLAFGGRV